MNNSFHVFFLLRSPGLGAALCPARDAVPGAEIKSSKLCKNNEDRRNFFGMWLGCTTIAGCVTRCSIQFLCLHIIIFHFYTRNAISFCGYHCTLRFCLFLSDFLVVALFGWRRSLLFNVKDGDFLFQINGSIEQC